MSSRTKQIMSLALKSASNEIRGTGEIINVKHNIKVNIV